MDKLIEMLFFFDESGDPGPNSSNDLFVLAGVKFEKQSDADFVDEAIRDLKRRLGFRGEFHFSKCSPSFKEAFFASLPWGKFSIHCIVVKKSALTSTHLKNRPKDFYRYFLRRVLVSARIRDAEVVIDGQGNREFTTRLKKYLNSHTKHQVKRLEMKDSKSDNLVQLADMVAGAVARANTDKPNRTDKWLKMLKVSSPDSIQYYN